MFRMFDRHRDRPNRFNGDNSGVYASEWFEIDDISYSYVPDILPPLWMRGPIFAMQEFDRSIVVLLQVQLSLYRNLSSLGLEFSGRLAFDDKGLGWLAHCFSMRRFASRTISNGRCGAMAQKVRDDPSCGNARYIVVVEQRCP
jgi:hypothetical protein